MPTRICLSLIIALLLTPISLALRIHAPVSVEATPLQARAECSGRFTAHQLDHITLPSASPVGFYDSNGAGLAVNDLNGDRLLDIALANLAGDNHIFWNRGGLRFERQALPSPAPARAAAILDVDGDGLPDIVFTQQAAAPLFWRNLGGERFETEKLPGVSYIGYAMNWLDADRDGDMDLVTGSYDVENEMLLGQTAARNGVIAYENLGERFRATRLGERSNTLAILTDINPAGNHEIVIGNDFAVEDRRFVFADGGWQEAPAPPMMPHSTMSYAAADLNNNGGREVFAVDMKPYSEDAATLAQWQPVMDKMMALPHVEGDPQIMENVLYARDERGAMQNIARDLRLDGTGWSWSAQFGDLDNDGFQDLYVVNGMISVELFSHLPQNELIEENLAYHNLGGAGFQQRADWGLNDRASGRGMALADLDADGDLDAVVNNLGSPAKIFENRLCGGDSIEVDLHWLSSGNRRGIGSQLTLEIAGGSYRRDISAVSGYLSGESSRAHFGFPAGSALQKLTVVWNDGEVSEIADIQANMLYSITRA